MRLELLGADALNCLGVSRPEILEDMVSRGAIDPADIVLELLYLGHRQSAEALMERPITVGPPFNPEMRWITHCRVVAPPPPLVLTHVERDPRHRCRNRAGQYYRRPLSDSALDRYQRLRVGMTVPHAVTLGLTMRELRDWRKLGWVDWKPKPRPKPRPPKPR